VTLTLPALATASCLPGLAAFPFAALPGSATAVPMAALGLGLHAHQCRLPAETQETSLRLL